MATEKLKSSPKLFDDETTAPVLDPGRGKTKTGQLWAYARDDRPSDGSNPPGIAYVYAPDRKAQRPIAHLAGFDGILQVDGYGGQLTQTLERIAEGWPNSEIDALMPWNFANGPGYPLTAVGIAPLNLRPIGHDLREFPQLGERAFSCHMQQGFICTNKGAI